MFSLWFLLKSAKSKSEAYDNAHMYLNDSISLFVDKISYLQWCLDTHTIPVIDGEFRKQWNNKLEEEFYALDHPYKKPEKELQVKDVVKGKRSDIDKTSSTGSTYISMVQKESPFGGIYNKLKEDIRPTKEEAISLLNRIDSYDSGTSYPELNKVYTPDQILTINFIAYDAENKTGIKHFHAGILDSKGRLIDERETFNGDINIYISSEWKGNILTFFVGAEGYEQDMFRRVVQENPFNNMIILKRKKTVGYYKLSTSSKGLQ